MTVIIIAHRLSTVKNSDKICVIKGGQAQGFDLQGLMGFGFRVYRVCRLRAFGLELNLALKA